VILAAGRGTRMRALTDDIPKPMLPLAGKPLLEHVLDRLREACFTRALIVTGYRAELIEEYFAGYPMETRFRRQDPIDGTATAARLARDFAGADGFILTFADILTDPADYLGMAGLLEADPAAQAVVGVKRVEDPCQGAAVYEQAGRVTAIIEKPPPGASATHWNSAGLYAFRPAVFEELDRVPRSPRGEFELTSAVAQMIAAGKRLLLYPVKGDWRDVGRPEDLEAARGMV